MTTSTPLGTCADIIGLGDTKYYSSTDGRYIFKKHENKKLSGLPLSLPKLFGPILSADIPAAIQNAFDTNKNSKTIVYDSSTNSYDVYSNDYITMFNSGEIDVDTSGNIDSYEYICSN